MFNVDELLIELLLLLLFCVNYYAIEKHANFLYLVMKGVCVFAMFWA